MRYFIDTSAPGAKPLVLLFGTKLSGGICPGAELALVGMRAHVLSSRSLTSPCSAQPVVDTFKKKHARRQLLFVLFVHAQRKGAPRKAYSKATTMTDYAAIAAALPIEKVSMAPARTARPCPRPCARSADAAARSSDSRAKGEAHGHVQTV